MGAEISRLTADGQRATKAAQDYEVAVRAREKCTKEEGMRRVDKLVHRVKCFEQVLCPAPVESYPLPWNCCREFSDHKTSISADEDPLRGLFFY